MIETVAETGSTNSDLVARAASGAHEGLWLRAERQTAGRGRLGRAWLGSKGNLYASTLVRLRPGDGAPTDLSFVAGNALFDTVAALNLGHHPEPRLKWPNDLMVGQAKLAGILLERAGDAVVVGIGLNIAFAPELPDRQTICLAEMGLPSQLDAAMLIEDLAAHFAQELAEWRSAGQAALLQRWKQRAHALGTRISATASDGSQLAGTYDGITEDGALRLVDSAGKCHIVLSGDITLQAAGQSGGET